MESALCLRYGPLPALPLRIPSPVKPTRVTLSSVSPPLTNYTNSTTSIYRRPGHGFRLVCAINGFPKPSTNDDDDGDDGKEIAMRGSVGASLALACVIGIISCGCCKMMSPIAVASTTKTQKSSSMMLPGIYPLGGKVALKSLLDMTVYLASSHGKHITFTIPSLKSPTSNKRPSSPSPTELATLYKKNALRLMKSGKGEDAVKLMLNAYKSCHGDPEPEFNVEMALVEVLICLGKYEEASKRNCLQPSHGSPSDGRVPLYQAIICTMLDRKEEARIWWKQYIRTVAEDIPNVDDLEESPIHQNQEASPTRNQAFPMDSPPFPAPQSPKTGSNVGARQR